MAKFKPYWITSSQDSSLSIVPGQFVVHTDTGEAFIDIDNNTRKSISGGGSTEIETSLTETQIKALTIHPKTIYIASDTHGIWYYDNGWVNLDTDTHQNAFGKIAIGGTDIEADSSEDTLTLVAGSNVTLTPDATNDSVTISAADTHQNAFGKIKVKNVDVEAESSEDTLTLLEGSNITLTPDAANDSVTISATGVATAAQGEKADSAVQNITINGSGTGITKSNNIVDLPAYPTTLPASNTTDTYSNSGTVPVSGKAVAAALGTLNVTGDSNISASKTIKSWSEADGKVNIETQDISITHNQISDAGDAITKNYTTSVSQNNGALVTSGAVYAAINNLPKPMVMRGTLGAIADGGKIQELPATSSAAIGDTYKVVTAGTYALQTAKVGDLFTLIEKNNTKSWLYIPSGDDIEDTHRVIKLNETEILGNNSVPLNLKNGDFINITSSQNATTGNMDVTVAHSDTSSQSSVSNSGRTYIQSITLDSAGHVTGLSSATETVTNTDTYVNNASFAHDNNNNNIKMTLTRNDNNTVKANIPKISSSTSGVVPKGNEVSSQSQSTKFLREDGTWAAPSYTTYSTATQSANGLMSSADKKKLDGVATGATANVGTVTKVSTGSGLTGGDITSTGTVKANLRSETKLTNNSAAATETSGRVYPVALDKSGYLAVNVPWTDNNTTYESKSATSGGTAVSLVTTGEKYIWNGKAAGDHTHPTTIATDSGTNQLTLAANTKYKLTAGGTSFIFTTPPDNNNNTWRAVKINNSEKLGTATSTGPLNLINGSGITIGFAAGDVAIGHTNSITAGTISEGGSARTLSFGGTFNIPSVTYDAQGHITATSTTTLTMPANPNTDTKVTSVDNHYSPSANENSKLTASATGATAAWGIDVVKGITVNRDAKGHVTGISVTSGKIPANPNTDTTYTLATGDSNGQIKVTPSSGNAYNVDVKGLGSAAYTASTAYATSGHTHATSIATSTGTNQITLAANTKYAITAGGTSYVFTTPPDNNTDTNVTQTETSTSANYEVLFSGTADSQIRTEGVRKSGTLLYNPSSGNFQVSKINGVSVGSSPKFTDTTYGADRGIQLNGNNYIHTNSVTAGTVSDGGAARTLAFGGTFKIPSVTYDAQGHITATSTTILTMPANPNTDTKVKLTDFEPSNTSTAYCIPFSSTHNGTAVELNSNSAIAYYGTNGTTSADGVACLGLGNATASGIANNKEGKLWLYSPSSGGCYLRQQATTKTVNHTFPTTSGTVLNSGTTSYTATTSSGTTGAYEIGKIKINGTETTIYGKDNNTKVTSVTKNPTTVTTYSVPFSPDNISNDNIFINDGLRYIVKEGTASSEGLASFRVGNATATGTAGNKSGDIRIFNGTGKSVVLTYANGGGTSYYQFRNTGGNAEPYTLLDSGVDIRNSYARKFSLSGSDTASTSGWYQIAEATITGYSNCHGVFAIYNTYQKETQFGIFKISLRCNNTSNTLVNDFTWVTRENGWTYDYICYVIDGNKVKLYVYQDVGQYGRIMAELLSESSITSGNSAWTMINSTSPTGGTSMSSKVYPVERCFGAGTKTISTASAKSVTIKIKGKFFRSGTQFYTAGLLKFHFNTAKLTSPSYTYGDYTYGSYNVSGNDGWIAVNGTSVTSLGQISSTIDSSSDTTTGAQTREVTLTIALSSSSFVTVEYDPQVYTVSQ